MMQCKAFGRYLGKYGLEGFDEDKINDFLENFQQDPIFQIVSTVIDEKHDQLLIFYECESQEDFNERLGIEPAPQPYWDDKYGPYTSEEMHEMLKNGTSVDELDLSANMQGDLYFAGIPTIEELIKKRGSDLLEIYGIGPKRLTEIRAKLAERGLHLRDEGGNGDD